MQSELALKVKVKVAKPEAELLLACKEAVVPLPLAVTKSEAGVTDQVAVPPGMRSFRTKLWANELHTGLVPPMVGTGIVLVVLGKIPLPLMPSQLLRRVAFVPPPAQEVKNLPKKSGEVVLVQLAVPPCNCPTTLWAASSNGEPEDPPSVVPVPHTVLI